MYSSLKISAITLVSAALLSTVGCATKPKNSEFVVAPMAVPGNAAYQTGPLVNNSAEVQAAAQNVRSIVRFPFDSSEIEAEAASILNDQVAFLASHPDARVLVAGHTDERGSREYNHALGERRAQAVRNYLASQGVTDARVETISYGEDRPVAAGTDEASHTQNRRAELSY
ncbi:peptidoglycan-associated lipoprotein Pal [Psychrobacter sanguinis]|uniref:peptidoglycan-associated lipoprotein Pal n=1 Tax=Psychrobacter sanguinis TaxID=861445 RepID=UPI001917D02A|nr:peptidoglycan-associated lipoprotein Pal [Psychrobacter sanguinis]MCC3308058.1 peptidoglycan-associated lipoprotein Pal [Psychrobacter sanguinis]MCC3344183.1 peptidoglycan-associated lipoprotein Pal [Psychrobacter sanguinis]MDY3306562.1 peptidoglycan-associated lipoprotein Pal [Psychrobacter sanguinis]UEC25342.1 peptidoglycan-associated lipoprotein Pal [Psychrobacter sanguinis]